MPYGRLGAASKTRSLADASFPLHNSKKPTPVSIICHISPHFPLCYGVAPSAYQRENTKKYRGRFSCRAHGNRASLLKRQLPCQALPRGRECQYHSLFASKARDNMRVPPRPSKEHMQCPHRRSKHKFHLCPPVSYRNAA